MQVSSLISFGWNAFPTYGKSLTFARKCLRQRRLNDVTLRGPEMMKTDAHKARFETFGRKPPRQISRFIIQADRKIPSTRSRVLTRWPVFQKPSRYDLNRQLIGHSACFERVTQIALEEILLGLFDILQHVEHIHLAIFTRLGDRLGLLLFVGRQITLDGSNS